MSKLTVIAHIRAEPDHVDFVKAELSKLLDPTRVEEGCINYDLHQDNDDPAHFVFHENWESEERLDRHLETPHIAAFIASTGGKLASIEIGRYTQTG